MNISTFILIAACLLVMPVTAQVSSDESTKKASKNGISFTEFGINLYGKFIFESEGELFDLSDSDSKILVPAGGVLVCVRQAYSIGYYGGGATIINGTKFSNAPKLFFILKPDGEVTFHLPSPDGNFFGEQITGTIEFKTLYKPDNTKKPNKSEQATPRKPSV